MNANKFHFNIVDEKICCWWCGIWFDERWKSLWRIFIIRGNYHMRSTKKSNRMGNGKWMKAIRRSGLIKNFDLLLTCRLRFHLQDKRSNVKKAFSWWNADLTQRLLQNSKIIYLIEFPFRESAHMARHLHSIFVAMIVMRDLQDLIHTKDYCEYWLIVIIMCAIVS